MQFDLINTELAALFADKAELELAVLIGSRSVSAARQESDWDIAIQWVNDFSLLELLDKTETLRREIAQLLAVTEACIDLIDIPTARLAMRSVIAEEGVLLKGDGELAWHHFLQRTWRELEDYYWEATYAA